MIPKVRSWKRDTVAELEAMLNNGSTIAVIDIHGVPAGTMIGMRESLRGDMDIRVAKKQLMRIAWKNAGLTEDDLETLFESAVQPAIVSTSKMNSFNLFTELKKTEAGRAAKPGDVAPYDIVVDKMDTGMPPGPIVGELNSVGIPAKIMKDLYKSKRRPQF